ncbi:MAG: PepSY domain-containing protein [Phycisphaerae bacterium]|nr:PepSY domain-containing protein [Phycisphaerae bacterium]
MRLRIVHRFLGVAAAPLMIVTAACGMVLLFRKTGMYERNGEFREFIQRLHNFEIVAPYVGTLVAVLMMAIAVTGVALWWQSHARQRKSRG